MTFSTAAPIHKNTSTIIRVIALVFAMFYFNLMSAQTQRLEGKIISAEDIDVEGINIQNLSKNTGTVSDDQGEFRITASLNDTLYVSALHIVGTTLIVGKDQMESKKIVIELSEKMNLLNTVTLRKPLTGYLLSDSKIIPTTEPITATSIGLPNADLKPLTKAESMLYSASSGPVDALINMLTGRTKMLKEYVKLEKKTQLTQNLLDKFPETYFTQVLKIDRFKIYSFLFFCEDDLEYEKIMKRTSMEIIEFLNRKSEEYRLSLSEIE